MQGHQRSLLGVCTKTRRETVETVVCFPPCTCTQLKLGVNKRCHSPVDSNLVHQGRFTQRKGMRKHLYVTDNSKHVALGMEVSPPGVRIVWFDARCQALKSATKSGERPHCEAKAYSEGCVSGNSHQHKTSCHLDVKHTRIGCEQHS